jgi:hypothetical protein
VRIFDFGILRNEEKNGALGVTVAAPFSPYFPTLGSEINVAIYRIMLRSSGIVIRKNE